MNEEIKSSRGGGTPHPTTPKPADYPSRHTVDQAVPDTDPLHTAARSSEDTAFTTDSAEVGTPQTRDFQEPGTHDSDPGATLEPGAGLSGRKLAHLRLGEKLGGGVVAAVYRGVDEKSGATVAVKALLTGADDVMRERFRREAELVRTLHHAHIVETLEVGETSISGALNGQEESITYIVMQMVEGCSLAQLLERQGRLSANDAAALLAPIAEALNYAHQQEIVHRDVKPSNILLRREEGTPTGSVRISALDYAVTPLLTDFGIARAMDAPELTNTGRTIGTPAFMSPEQCAAADELDGRSDVYGLGAVLYRCIVGKTPYSGSTTQMLYAHVYEPLLIPDEMVALLPPIALSALQRAMMKDPNHRYQNAGDMAADLSIASGRIPQESQANGSSSTVTMPAMPAVRREDQSSTSRVLVPVTMAGQPSSAPGAVPPTPKTFNRPTVKLETAAPSRKREVRTAPRLAGHAKRLRARWGAPVALSIAALLLIVAGISVFAFVFGPQGRDWIAEIQGGIINQAYTVQTTPTPSTTPPGSAAAIDPDGTNARVNDLDRTPAITETSSADSTSNDSAANARGTPDADSTPATDSPQTDMAPEDGTETPEPEETPLPSSITLESAWEEAQESFAAADWDEAREWLLIVRRLDPEYEAEQVHNMLAATYLELAQMAYEIADVADVVDEAGDGDNAGDAGDADENGQDNANGADNGNGNGNGEIDADDESIENGATTDPVTTLDTSLRLLILAAQEQVDAELVDSELGARLEAAYLAYERAHEEREREIQASLSNGAASNGVTDPQAIEVAEIDEEIIEELRAALADVADALAEGRVTGTAEPCMAVTYGVVAVALGDTTESAWLDGLQIACSGPPTPQPPQLAGNLIYSSQEGDSYRIYSMSASSAGASTLLVDHAAQPRLARDGQSIAFYSRQQGAQGLGGLNLAAGQSPSSRGIFYTGQIDDSRDSPPSWSPDGDRLAFSSARGDGRHRIYVTSADNNHQVEELLLGRDPAWHPREDLLVFNGVDQSEQNPGLWLIRPDGTELRQLTDNGNDLRPVWTPDGRFVVFMSNGRDGNWEVYRIDVETREIIRLTYNDSQDGLPAISPDGAYVAFASDRAGFWEFWYVPLSGGGSLRLGPMQGQMVSWLEHGIQWVP